MRARKGVVAIECFLRPILRVETINSLPTNSHARTNFCDWRWYERRGFRGRRQLRRFSGSANSAGSYEEVVTGKRMTCLAPILFT
jgi:hypothetical protein